MDYSFSKLSQKLWVKDVFFTILFGSLSVGLSYIKLSAPGIEGVFSDLRELPLIVGIFHVSNPFFSIGLSAITLLHQPADGSYISTYLMHVLPLFLTWYLYHYLKRRILASVMNFALSFVFVLSYYLVMVLPLLILTNYLVGLNLHKPFFPFYKELSAVTMYENIITALFCSVYFMNYKIRIELSKLKISLEQTVSDRTRHLNSTILKLKETQNYLVLSEKMAALSTLTSGVAHEINNPLNFISGGEQLIKEYCQQGERDQSDKFKDRIEAATNMINEGVQRISYIVNALMAFSVRGKSRLEDKDINQIIDNTLLFIAPNIPKDIEIIKNYTLKEKVPVYIEKFHQVILNLLHNALYELERHASEQRKISIHTSLNEDYAKITIANTGPRIFSENLEKIFEPFFTTKEPDQGKGLGLSISYTYVMEHMGQIRAENLSDGVRFVIKLPRKQPSS